MRRFRVKPPFHLHSEKGHLMPNDELLEGWLPERHLAELLEGGSIEEIQEPPVVPAAIMQEPEPDIGIELIQRKRGKKT